MRFAASGPSRESGRLRESGKIFNPLFGHLTAPGVGGD